MKILNLIKKKKDLSKDIVYNIGASLILIGTMQCIVYPFFAWKYTSVAYGEILTVMGIVQTIIATCGNALNNVRLMVDADYSEDGIKGDFNLLLVIMIAVSIVTSIGLILCFFKQGNMNCFLLALYVAAGIANSYYCVYFRLILDFKKILIQKAFGAVGFLIGICIFYVFPYWPAPFIVSEFVQMLVILRLSGLYREPFLVTGRMGSTVSKLAILMVSTLSGNLINYLDRLVLYPLLGGEGVTSYSVASFFGKGLGIALTPIAGVLLGYYSQKGYRMTYRKFWGINGIAGGCGLVFVWIAALLSPFFTKLLYPKVYDSASEYLLLANLAAVVSVACTLTQSAVLKFAPAWIQLVKEGIYGVLYLLLGFYMLRKYGLYGFCIAAVTANFAKLFTLYILGGFYIKKQDAITKPGSIEKVCGLK